MSRPKWKCIEHTTHRDTIIKMEVHLSDPEKKMLRIDRHSATHISMYERGQRESTYQESHVLGGRGAALVGRKAQAVASATLMEAE